MAIEARQETGSGGAGAPLFVVGGEQRVSFREQPEWTMYERALVVRVRNGVPEPVLSWQSPPEHRPDERPSLVFKSATIVDGTAYLCTQTEVLLCDFPSFTLRRVISLPCFNDVHHVAPGPDGLLYVVSTGLDAVAIVTPEGALERLVDVLGGSPWDRFSPDVDYRKVPTTKPHRAHPNFVFFLDGRPWVTRFEQRDAVPLEGPGEPFSIHAHGAHDGHVVGDGVWFTTVDGRIVRFDVATRERADYDLNSLNPDPDLPLGWCRGLLVEGSSAWVGFSRIRFTKLRQNLSWVRHGFKATTDHRNLPTRIARYDLAQPALVETIDLEPAGMGAVFGVYGPAESETGEAAVREDRELAGGEERDAVAVA